MLDMPLPRVDASNRESKAERLADPRRRQVRRAIRQEGRVHALVEVVVPAELEDHEAPPWRRYELEAGVGREQRREVLGELDRAAKMRLEAFDTIAA